MQAFFLPVRLAIAMKEDHGMYHNLYRDTDDFRRRAGAKLRGLLHLVLHVRKHDDIAMPVYRRGHPTHWPEVPDTPDAGTRKIVIMHEFTMMAELIASVSYPSVASVTNQPTNHRF